MTQSIKNSDTDLNNAKNQFIAIASHKLFTPLTVIKLQIENLQNARHLSVEAQKSISDISENIKKLEDFANVLLKISDIENDILLTESSINIKSLIKEVFSKYRNKIDEKKIKVDFEINCPGHVTIEFDESYLRYMLSVVVENSIIYNNNGGYISINVSCEGNILKTKISDSGIGILKKDHEHIFSSFYRGQNTQKLDVKSYGLGLFTVKKLMKKIKGDIYFRSNAHKGSIFFLEIPLKRR